MARFYQSCTRQWRGETSTNVPVLSSALYCEAALALYCEAIFGIEQLVDNIREHPASHSCLVTGLGFGATRTSRFNGKVNHQAGLHTCHGAPGCDPDMHVGTRAAEYQVFICTRFGQV